MRDLRRMRRSRTVAVVVVAMVVAWAMVMTVVAGVGVSHQNMLYYNITGVHAGPDTASRSRGRYARALLRFRALKGGREEGRVRAAPAVSCAACAKRNAHEHTGSAGAFRPSLRNGFTAYGALSPVNGLFCHRRPCEALASQELDASIAAPGPHDFAVRNRARSSVVPSAATASHRAFRDDREPPLLSGGTGKYVRVICPSGKAKSYPTG
jgi:hypothetical protein